jgi:hypothetical protein
MEAIRWIRSPRFRLTGIAEPPDTPFAEHPMRADIAPYWLAGSHREAASNRGVQVLRQTR